MTSPKLSDEAVGRLPLSAARAELMEEIMQTDAAPAPLTTTRGRRASGWLPAVGVAAAVATLVVGGVVAADLGGDGGDGLTPATTPPHASRASSAPTPAASASAEPAPTTAGEWPVLTHLGEGWRLETVYGDSPAELTVAYAGPDGLSFEINTYPAGGGGPDPEKGARVEETTFSGMPAVAWSDEWKGQVRARYLSVDLGRGRLVLDGRGRGIDGEAWSRLLDHVALVSRQDFEALVDDVAVSGSEAAAFVREVTADIPLAPGTGAEDIVLTGSHDRYQAGADVVGQVLCGWYDAWDAGLRDETLAALDGSEQWDLLVEMDRDGDYPEVVHEVAGRLRAGDPTELLRPGTGSC